MNVVLHLLALLVSLPSAFAGAPVQVPERIAVVTVDKAVLRQDCSEQSPVVKTFDLATIVTGVDSLRRPGPWTFVSGPQGTGCLSLEQVRVIDRRFRDGVYVGQKYLRPGPRKTDSEVLLEAAGVYQSVNEPLMRLLMQQDTEVRHVDGATDMISTHSLRLVALSSLARHFERELQIDKAMTLYEQAAKGFPHNVWPGLYLGPTGAFAALQAAKLKMKSKPREAISALVTIIKQHPEVKVAGFEWNDWIDSMALREILNIMAAGTEGLPDRDKVLAKVIKKSKSGRVRAQAKIQRAMWFLDQGQDAAYEQSLRRAASENESAWSVFKTRGHFGAAALHALVEHLIEDQRADEATKLIANVLDDSGAAPEIRMVALYHKGMILADRDDLSQADSALSEALELSRKARIYDLSVSTRPVSFTGAFIGEHQIRKRLDGLIRVAP